MVRKIIQVFDQLKSDRIHWCVKNKKFYASKNDATSTQTDSLQEKKIIILLADSGFFSNYNL